MSIKISVVKVKFDMSLNKISGNGNFPQDINTQNSDLKRVYIKSLHENKRDEVSFSGKSADKKPQKHPIAEFFKKTVSKKPPETPERRYNNEILQKLEILQKQGYLTKVKFKHTNKNSRINPALASDIEKMYLCLKGEKTNEELFMPNFKDSQEAEKSLNTGDIFIIGDKKNISIKTKKGEIKPLNMSPELYFKLFSPGHRYSFCQQKSGDCYLVSPLYALSANPDTREIILSCFDENPDGTVDVKFPKGNTTFNLDVYGYNKKYSPEDEIVSSCEGIMALEFAYGKDISNSSIELSRREAAESQAGIIDAKEHYENIVKAKISGIEKRMSPEGEISLDDLVSVDFDLNEGDNVTKFMKFVTLKNFGDYIEKTDNNDVYKIDLKKYNEQKLKERNRELKVYQDIINTYQNMDKSAIANKERGNGGMCSDVFAKFGLATKGIWVPEKQPDASLEDFEQLNQDLDKTDGSMLFLASTDEDMKNGNFWTDKHVYIVTPEKSSDEKIVYRITNPWNTAFSRDVTKNELFKKFSFFTTVNIE